MMRIVVKWEDSAIIITSKWQGSDKTDCSIHACSKEKF